MVWSPKFSFTFPSVARYSIWPWEKSALKNVIHVIKSTKHSQCRNTVTPLEMYPAIKELTVVLGGGLVLVLCCFYYDKTVGVLQLS